MPNPPAIPEQAEPELSAYALLSKPTLELTEEEVQRIVVDLRRKRELFLQGTADKAPKRSTAPAIDNSPEAKKQRTADLLAGLKL